MIRYFVSYTFQTSGNTFGSANCEVTLPKPISSMAEVRTIGNWLANDRGVTNVVVMAFSVFADNGDTGGAR